VNDLLFGSETASVSFKESNEKPVESNFTETVLSMRKESCDKKASLTIMMFSVRSLGE
jgi:hypothetical protein